MKPQGDEIVDRPLTVKLGIGRENKSSFSTMRLAFLLDVLTGLIFSTIVLSRSLVAFLVTLFDIALKFKN